MESSLQVEKQVFTKAVGMEVFNSIDFEKIIDHPNILIAANFWEKEKYEAAKTCYKFMRAIDDLIDNYKSKHVSISPEERIHFEEEVNKWINSVINAAPENDFQNELLKTIAKFKIPAWPLEAFAHSMIYDIYNDGFVTLQSFIDYAGGASVAPASIFVHLCGLKKENDKYILPCFDVKETATPCAIFSYLVHIIRDFVKDHTNNLNYFPDNLMLQYNLDREKLLTIAKGGEITTGFREMISELYTVADQYRMKTFETKERIKPLLEPRGRLSLEIVFALYRMVFDRIDIVQGTFSTEELNPTASEIKEIVRQTIENFKF